VQLSVRLFASLREAAGASFLTIELPDNATADSLTAAISETYPHLRELGAARVSVNYEYVNNDHPLQATDEVAIIPPVSGGSLPYFEITDQVLTTESVSDLVRSPECGAVTVFVGTARRTSQGREVEHLEY